MKLKSILYKKEQDELVDKIINDNQNAEKYIRLCYNVSLFIVKDIMN